MKPSKIFKVLFLMAAFAGMFYFSGHAAEFFAGSGTVSMAFFGAIATRRNNSYNPGQYAPSREEARRKLSSLGGGNSYGRSVASAQNQPRNPYSNAGGTQSNPWFSFGGPNSSFWDVVQNPSCKYFPVFIVNTDPVNDYNILFTGGIQGAPGTTNLLLCDGAIPGTGGLVTASAGYNSINELQQYQYQNPTALLGMKISSNNSLQIAVTGNYQPFEPYTPQLTSTVIPFINYTDEDDFKSAFLTLDLRMYNIEMGNQSEFTVPIVANSSTQFLIYLGPTVNSTHYLRSQFQTGVNNAVRSGAKMSKMGGKRR
jgi:hypothetical protein